MIRFSLRQALCNFVVLLLTGLPVLIFKTAVTPYHRGYHCGDDSIQYPYRSSTVTTGVLILTGFLIPLLSICILEAIRLKVESDRMNPSEIPIFQIGSRKLHRWLVRVYIFVGYFIYGAAVNQIITDVGKYSIGRLRPHFIAVCKPDPLPATCDFNNKFISADTFKCSGTNAHLNTESRLSFPSGHASFSFYAMVYLVLYIEARVVWYFGSPLIKTSVQLVFIALAAWCSYTRISDYKHHWSDVLTGAVLGITVAILNGVFVAKLFERREKLNPSLKSAEDGMGLVVLSKQHISQMRHNNVPVAKAEDLGHLDV